MAAVAPAPDLAARLAPIAVTEASGEQLRLGHLWADRTAVLVHLRHFG